MININKKHSSTLALVLLAIVAIGFAATSIIFKNNVTANPSGINKIITQNNGSTSGGDMSSIESCFEKPESEVQKCMDDFMIEYFQGKTTKQVLADIESARTQSSKIENDCHPIVHAVGRETYRQTGNIGDAFEACDQTCHSGCYHGVMERLFYSDTELSSNYAHLTFEDMKEKIPGICNADKFKNPSNAVIFQCLHGVGHAILYTLDYNLDDSLKSCDLFPIQYDRSSCYGGVIMENVTAFDKKKRDMKRDDPSYPCSRLDNRYKSDCYLMQTSIMTEYGLNNEAIAAECRKAGDYESQCFISMGRDLSNYVRTGYTDYVVQACEVTAGDRWQSCLDGALYALIDNTWDLSFAYQLCDALKNPEHVRTCYVDSSSYFKSSYTKTDEDVQNACRSFSQRNRDLCLSL